jgi:xanthine/CO dehydrogenase XdhC/CoxF family maturation factor
MADQSEAEVLAAAREWKAAGHRVALATVVKTWGSSPRPPGSHLAVRDDSFFLGSVSGGCVEGRVVEEALSVMETGTPKLVEFGVSNDEAWEVGLACGGRVEIYVEALE